MIRLILSIILVLVCSSPLFSQDNEEQSLMNQADALFNAGNYNSAWGLYTRVYADYDNAEAKEKQGLALRCRDIFEKATTAEANKEFPNAIVYYQDLLTLNPYDRAASLHLELCENHLKSTIPQQRNGDTPSEQNQSKIAHLSLAVRKDGKMYYFSRNVWNSIDEKFRYEKIGVVVYVSEIPFIVDLHDVSNEISWRKSNKKYGQYLPTLSQAKDIVSCFPQLDAALTYFGGTSMDRQYYWTLEPVYGGGWHVTIDTWSNKPAGLSNKPEESYHRSMRKVYPIE